MRCSCDIAVWLRRVLVTLFVVAGLPWTAHAEESCVTCHASRPDARLRNPVERMRGSAHARALGCAGCHGGRGAEPTTAAHDPASGFLARPDANAIANRCGACHADARFVRRFREDLPTDQLALYFADAHGRGVTAGDTHAPTCTSCHGTHDVRSPRDPASTVTPRHVHETCGNCHANSARIPARLPTTQLSLWRNSVHGRALLDASNDRAPTCNGCHGEHGEFREAGGPEGQCRACHDAEAAAFDRSPHAAVYRRLGFSGCVACHGSHDVREARGALGTAGGMGVCRRCHADGRGSYDLARRIASDAERARADLAAAVAARSLLEREGWLVPEITPSIDAANQAEIRLRVAVHALDEAVAHEAAEAVRIPARRAQLVAEQARARAIRARRTWLIAVPLLALLAVLARLKLRRLERRGSSGD